VRLYPAPADGARPYHLTGAGDGAMWVSFLDLAAITRVHPDEDEVRVFPLPHLDSRARRLVRDDEGGVWYADLRRRALAWLDPLTGAVGEIASRELGWMPYGLVLGPGGRLWVGDAQQDRIVVFDPASGEAIPLGLPAAAVVVRNLAADPARGRIWFVMGEAGALGRVDVSRSGAPEPVR
jgi:sugar lactone lactonase YvrE